MATANRRTCSVSATAATWGLEPALPLPPAPVPIETAGPLQQQTERRDVTTGAPTTTATLNPDGGPRGDPLSPPGSRSAGSVPSKITRAGRETVFRGSQRPASSYTLPHSQRPGSTFLDEDHAASRNTTAATTITSASASYGERPPGIGANHDSDKKRPALSMRLVISLFFAVTVLVVSSVTFTITYLTSIETVEAVGLSYARVLAEAARGRTEALFDVPAAAAVALARTMQQKDSLPLPTDDATEWGTLAAARDATAQLFFGSPDDLSLAAVIFDDGSRVVTGHAVRHSHLGLTGHTMLHAGSINRSSLTRCCGTPRQHFVYRSNGTRYPQQLPLAQPVEDARNAFYQSVRSRASANREAYWGPVNFNNLELVQTSFLVVLVVPVWNATDSFMGIHTTSVSTLRLSRFLRELDVTPNSVAFGLISDGTIIASTHAVDFQTITPAPADASVASVASATPNCVHSASINPVAVSHVIACRAFARDFPYAPLQAVANDERMMRPTANRSTRPAVRVVDIDGDGEVTAVATGLTNVAAPLPLSLMLFVPRRDLLGSTEERRNVVIGIVVGVVVAASLASFAFTSRVLGALKRVSKQMSRTARLRDPASSSDAHSLTTTTGLGEPSSLAEIYDIQRAYGDMAVAIGSFTRYVPRDVVRDLLRSGELCALAMAPRRCTMLFSDIQGFTTMCERVPAADLSELVHGYFERMTRLVGSHGGIVDKFIGDAVMAVWGAPFAIGNAELRATLCGLRMTRETRVAPLAPLFDAAGEVLRIRVGVATGDVLAGNMGSAERMSYTVIGDAVNLASRLRDVCQATQLEMIVCGATAAELAGAVSLRLLMRVPPSSRRECGDPSLTESSGAPRRDATGSHDDTAEQQHSIDLDAGPLVYQVIGLVAAYVPPEIVGELRHADRAALDSDDSAAHGAHRLEVSGLDSGSVSSLGSHRGSRRVPPPTGLLYDEAARSEEATLVVDDEVAQAAAAFSRAAEAFCERNYGAAVSLLRGEPLFATAATFDMTDRVHWQILREAERRLQDSAEASFDGGLFTSVPSLRQEEKSPASLVSSAT